MGVCYSSQHTAPHTAHHISNSDKLAFITPLLDSEERESIIESCGELGTDSSSKFFVKRKKNIAYVIHIHGEWFQVNKDYFTQNESYNDFSGGYKRTYNTMQPQFIDSKPVQKLLNEFKQTYSIPSGELVLVQVQSSHIDVINSYDDIEHNINPDGDNPSDEQNNNNNTSMDKQNNNKHIDKQYNNSPVEIKPPITQRQMSITGQGIHSDGSDYAMLVCLKRDNITGAKNSVYNDLQGNDTLINPVVLEEGNCLFWCDNKVYHYVNPARLINKTKKGLRTVLIAHYPAIHHLKGTVNPNNTLGRNIVDQSRQIRNI